MLIDIQQAYRNFAVFYSNFGAETDLDKALHHVEYARNVVHLMCRVYLPLCA